MKPDTSFVVMRDQDAAPCFAHVRDRLQQLCKDAGRPDTLVRVACRELEAWTLGDLNAIDKAFGTNVASKAAYQKRYENPDGFVRPIEEVRKLVPTYQKLSGAREIGPHLDLRANKSPSFQAFCRGMQRIAAELG